VEFGSGGLAARRHRLRREVLGVCLAWPLGATSFTARRWAAAGRSPSVAG
jgi:hypothetical protein